MKTEKTAQPDFQADQPQKNKNAFPSPAPQKAKSESLKANIAAYKKLCERYAVFREHKPLAIGILGQLLDNVEDISRSRLRRLIHYHVNLYPYLKAVNLGGKRYNLDGSEAGDINEESKDYSAKCMVEQAEKRAAYLKKQSEKRPKPKKKNETVTVTSKSAAQRQKLQMLAKKFGKNQ